MMKIDSLADLKIEQRKLRSRRVVLETTLLSDLVKFNEELQPLVSFTKGAGNVLVSKNNGILGNSVGFIANFITKNVLLKNSGLITRLIVPYLVKNSTSSLVENNKSQIVEWVGNVISKFANRKNALGK
ncbi:MAG: hypothetical protein K8R85_03090 [Bacteroidetes bacterium]|nr:hypothetical protein [Bacteroidota bacterium]